jgi:hypothetical protein
VSLAIWGPWEPSPSVAGETSPCVCAGCSSPGAINRHLPCHRPVRRLANLDLARRSSGVEGLPIGREDGVAVAPGLLPDDDLALRQVLDQQLAGVPGDHQPAPVGTEDGLAETLDPMLDTGAEIDLVSRVRWARHVPDPDKTVDVAGCEVFSVQREGGSLHP